MNEANQQTDPPTENLQTGNAKCWNAQQTFQFVVLRLNVA